MKRKKTTRQKGNDYQVWIRDWLQARDWTVHNFPMSMRPLFIPDDKNPGQTKMIWKPQENDVFGCDLIARKETALLWIQATMDDHVARRLDSSGRYFKELSPSEILMIWMKKEKGTWVRRVHTDPRGVLHVVDVGKIIQGKFIPEQGISTFFFGAKEKK